MLDLDVRIYDLSAGGCFVESIVEAKLGESVRLRIDLAGEGQVEAVGIVVPSTRSLGYAVQFVEVEAAAQARIERTVGRLAFSRQRP